MMMKHLKKYVLFGLALVLCLSLAACGDSNDPEEDSPAPGVIEEAVYDSAADASGYDEYFGTWEGTGSAEGDTLDIEAADGGMYFTLYSEGDLTASGYAQNIPEYAFIYFFNQHDGNAYQVISDNSGEMEINSFGTFVMKTPAPETSGEFEDIADVWYLDGDPAAASSIEIRADGEWTLYERPDGDGDPTMVDGGYLEQDHGIAEQYYAHSRQFENVTYDMHMTLEKEAFWWGGENDTYLRSTLANVEETYDEEKYIGYWYAGEDNWLRIYADMRWDSVDENGEVINSGVITPDKDALCFYTEDVGFVGELLLQDDGSLLEENSQIVYVSVTESEVPEGVCVDFE